MGARSSFKPRARLPSGPDSVVSAWLRVDDAVRDGSGISLVPDMLNTNPAVQTVAARKPSLELSANGLPCMRFATNDQLTWPITPQSLASNQTGWGLWVKLGVASGNYGIMRARNESGGASANKLSLTFATSGYQAAYYVSAVSGLRTAAIATTDWQFITIEFDGGEPLAELQRTLTHNGVLSGSTGGGATSGALQSATGNILIGNGGSDSLPLNGLIGPNIYAFSGKMSGAEFGVLTTAARNALMNFEAPT